MPRRVGHITRGKTALNRLRQVDVYVALVYAGVLRGGQPWVVDVGYGAQAWTALEMRERWLPINPQLRLLGIEIDPARVEVALPYAIPNVIDFQVGGFNVKDNLGNQQARLIRAYNVLRQYTESEVKDALNMMALSLAEGGLLVEGTSNPSGRLMVFDVYRKTQHTLEHLELVFASNFRERLLPIDFQAVLPKRLIHHAHDPQPYAFFEAWTQALNTAKGQGQGGIKHSWRYAARRLRQLGYAVNTSERLLRRGYLAIRGDFTRSS
jgi:hypothetical protein